MSTGNEDPIAVLRRLRVLVAGRLLEVQRIAGEGSFAYFALAAKADISQHPLNGECAA